MFEWLFPIDHFLFQLIHDWGSHSLLNPFFKYVTDLHKQPSFLVVIFGFLGYWIYKKRKMALKQFGVLVLLAGMSDLLCYQLIKQSIYRARPNQDPRVSVQLKVNYGPKSSSFPSNHSTSTFAMMAFLAWSFRKYRKAFWGLALLVAYSRVYVGVHYPSDVIVGAMLGIFIGWMGYKLSYGFIYPAKS